MKQSFPLESQYVLLLNVRDHLKRGEYATASLMAHAIEDLSHSYEFRPDTLESSSSIARRLDGVGLSVPALNTAMYQISNGYEVDAAEVERLSSGWDRAHADILKRLNLSTAEKAEYDKRFSLEGAETRAERLKILANAKWTGNDLVTLKELQKADWNSRKAKIEAAIAAKENKTGAEQMGVSESLFVKLKDLGMDTLEMVFNGDFLRYAQYAFYLAHVYMVVCLIRKLLEPSTLLKIFSAITAWEFLYTFVARLFVAFMIKFVNQLPLPDWLQPYVAAGVNVAQTIWYLSSVEGFWAPLLTGVFVTLKGVGSWVAGYQSPCEEVLKYQMERKEWFQTFQRSLHALCSFTASYLDVANLKANAMCDWFVDSVGLTDAFQLLGSSATDSMDVIRKRYKELTIKYHPDKNMGAGAEEAAKKMLEINKAWDMVKEYLDIKK